MADTFNPWANVPLTEAMPFGAGATPQGDPTVLSGMLSGVMNMPKHLVEAATNAPQPGLRRQDATDIPGGGQPGDDLVGQSWETARALGQQAPAVAAENAAGIFGGKLAQGADLKMLNEAKQAAANGYLNSEIRAGTGWFQTPSDRQWKFEIPDNEMRMLHMPHEEASSLSGPVFAMAQHDKLFKAYPELRNMHLDVTKDSTIFAPGDPSPKSIGGYYPVGSSGNLSPFITVRSPSTQQAQSTLAHELQHGVQQIEGFAGGADPSHYSNLIMQGWRKNPAVLQGNPLANVLNEAYPLYYKTAGEVEARNVQNRLPWTPEQRAKIHPWYSQDVPNRDQVVYDPLAGTIRALRGNK